MGLKREIMSGNNGATRAPQLQDVFLESARRQAVTVTIYLMNGFQLRGTVRGYDAFTIVLEYEGRAHLIYKHAVSTISPQTGLAPFAGDALP